MKSCWELRFKAARDLQASRTSRMFFHFAFVRFFFFLLPTLFSVNCCVSHVPVGHFNVHFVLSHMLGGKVLRLNPERSKMFMLHLCG